MIALPLRVNNKVFLFKQEDAFWIGSMYNVQLDINLIKMAPASLHHLSKFKHND
jgi:hypothetical protein